MYVLILYLFSSVCLYGLMSFDKHRAIQGKWRIPERTLLTWAVFGGAVGGWIAMKKFKHKTNKALFKYGFPILAVLQIALFFVILFFGDTPI